MANCIALVLAARDLSFPVDSAEGWNVFCHVTCLPCVQHSLVLTCDIVEPERDGPSSASDILWEFQTYTVTTSNPKWDNTYAWYAHATFA